MNEFKYSDQSHFEAEFQLRNFHRSTCGCLEFVLTQRHPIEKIPRFAPLNIPSSDLFEILIPPIITSASLHVIDPFLSLQETVS